MKKILFSMFAVAGMLFATSCQNDELVQEPGGEAQVSFTLGVENVMNTRAISDGSQIDRLVYAVFDAEGNRITGVEAVEKTVAEFPVTETINLAKGRTYQIAFWAQNSNCEAYTLDTNTMQVTVDYENAVNNDETRDAFFRSVTISVNSDVRADVVLRRAVAQVNLGVTAEDWDAAVACGFVTSQTNVTVKNVANTLNLLTGAVSGKTQAQFTSANLPEETLRADVDDDGKQEEYHWLSMCYFLVNDEQTALNPDGSANDVTFGDEKAATDLNFGINPTSGAPLAIGEAQGLADVPVRRNWRTNILGQILTGTVEFKIDLDPTYDGDDNYDYSGIEIDTYAAMAAGGVFNFSTDLHFEQQVVFMADATINGNNTSIIDETGNYAFVVEQGTVTVNNMGIQTKNGGAAARGPKSHLIINSGDFLCSSAVQSSAQYQTADRYCVVSGDGVPLRDEDGNHIYIDGKPQYEQSVGALVTINGGNFQVGLNNRRRYVYVFAGNKCVINGGTFGKASEANDVVKSGMGNDEGGELIINGGTFGFDVTKWVAETSTVVEENGVWTVTPKTAE